MDLARKFGPAVTSLAVAIVLWLVVHNLDRSPARFTVPITYEGSNDVVALDGRVMEVEVQVRATKPKLRTLQASAFVVRVRHADDRFGREFVVLDSSDVEAPFGVVVERVTPSQFWVSYDRRVTRQVAIKADVQGTPAAGYEVVSDAITVRPPSVLLSGPESLFGTRTTIDTERVDVSDLTATLVASHVALLPPGPTFTIDRSADIEATVPIRPVRVRKSFDAVSIEVLGADSRTSRPNPRTIKVTIEGDALEVAELLPSAVRATVNVAGLEASDEDYHLEPEVSVDKSACPSCKVVTRSQGRIDISVKPARKPARRRSDLSAPGTSSRGA